MPNGARGGLHQRSGGAAEFALLSGSRRRLGRPSVIRNFAAFLLLGVLFCSSQIAVAQGTSDGSQGGGEAAAQESSSPFDPLPLVKKGEKLVPDLDKMWGSQQMHFTLLKQPSKRNALLAWGGIDVGDSTRFLEAMKAAKPIEEVWLFSPGGSLDEGLEMGRLVHK